MYSSILMPVCLLCLAALVPAWFVLWLRESGVRPLARLLARFRRMPRWGRAVVLLLSVHLIVFGSTKQSPPNLLRVVRPVATPSFDSGFTADEMAVGYVPWRIGTNETWEAESPGGSAEVAEWRTRGAAEDWVGVARSDVPFAEAGDVAYMTSSGDIAVGDLHFSSLGLPLSLAPAANAHLLPSSSSGSVAWRQSTDEGSFVGAWIDGLLCRSTNALVSVAAELSRDGDVLFRYDLSCAGETARNCVASVSRDGRAVSVALAENVTSVRFYRLRPGDRTVADRDGDGLSSWDEINVYQTDPGLADSDGDGILDGDEVALGTDPTVRSVSDGEILARVSGSATNEAYQVEEEIAAGTLAAVKLWDGFAAARDSAGTNLVYERTLAVNAMDGWRHYFLSSLPDAAGDWDLQGLVLEWEDGGGSAGTARLSPVGDSLYLPLTNASGSVTIRLRATDANVRCAKPLYLLSYAPVISLSGCVSVCDPATGDELALVALRDAENPLQVAFDRSARPSTAPLRAAEMRLPGIEDIATVSDGRLRFAGSASGGTLEILRAGECALPRTWPASGGGAPLRLRGGRPGRKLIALDPSIRFCAQDDWSPTSLLYDFDAGIHVVTNSYPLDSRCLWRNWSRSDDGRASFESDPVVTSGADDLPYVTTSCTETEEAATGSVSVYGQEVWTGTALRRLLGVSGGGWTSDAELLREIGDCETCADDCADGLCDSVDGASLGSVRFRVSLGAPRLGQHSGFVHFRTDGPVAVSPACFRCLARADAQVTAVTNGSAVTYSCRDARGRDVTIEEIAAGVRVVARTHATGALEYTWELVNENGEAARIRIRQISRAGNVMKDETYVCADGAWSWTDRISGVCETVSRVNGLNDPQDGRLVETRTVSDGTGVVSTTVTESSKVGIGVNAVLRQTCWQESSGRASRWRRADYWDDAAHGARHGRVKAVWGDCVNWSWHDYDANGCEILRVEQRNGSPRPQVFPVVADGALAGADGLSDAWATVFGYEPFEGDDASAEDAFRPRCETRFVVRGGAATVIGRTWHRYTHVTHGGMAAVRHETWRAASPSAGRDDASNAYSWETTLSETAPGVPLVLRGCVAESRNEDGLLCSHSFSVADGRVVDEVRKSLDGACLPVFDRIARDATHGTVLREATYLAAGDVLIDETVSSYDEKNRLRARTFFDGTSLTNAYSCCRLLWSEDRLGRRTLRSAVTGQDRLYSADEDVWLRDMSTNGLHRVTQHFMDGLGRETNVVVYVAETVGEATNRTASAGRAASRTATSYPYGGSDYMVSVDGRGKRTVVEMTESEDSTRTVERLYEGDAPDCTLETETTRVRGGPTVVARRWEGKWTRARSLADYGPDGRLTRYEITESSDCGVVTNRIVRCDFLGRTVRVETPQGDTSTTYLGSTGRADTTVFSADGVSRTTVAVYDAFGARVGGVCDGVTTRRDSSWQVDGTGVWWRVERTAVVGSVTNSVAETRTRLTGLAEDGLLSHVVSVSAAGIVDDVREWTGASSSERVTVTSNSVGGVSTRTTRYGLAVETAGADGSRVLSYDALGRNVRVSREDGRPECASEYDGAGDLVAERTYTGVESFVTTRYGYDAFGRRLFAEDELGGAVTTRYDAVGHVVERLGSTQPVRFAYDTAGRCTSLSTTRDGIIWDVTRWSYDPRTGQCTAKRYADDTQSTSASAADGAVLLEVNPSGSWSRASYDAARRLVGIVSSDGKADAAFGHDEFGRVTMASNAVASCVCLRSDGGVATNETVTVGTNVLTYVRAVDAFGRVCGRGIPGERWQSISYDGRGRVAAVSNEVASVLYAYDDDGWDAGCTTTLAGGTVVRRQVVRDPFRRELIRAVTNFVNGVAVDGYDYARDASGRIVGRNASVFTHDAAGRTTAAGICEDGAPAATFVYAYDRAGNFLSVTRGTNVVSCTVNALNQCVLFGGEDVTMDDDGCVAAFGGVAFGYDANLRLEAASTANGPLVAFAHDAFGRRAVRTGGGSTTVFFYDEWSLVREIGTDGGGNVRVVDCFWGRDASGTLDGAGGVGGLVCLVRDGAAYVPLYDASGNITAYVDASGAVVARYVYDVFGNVISSSGEEAGGFRFGFSTKYRDEATGLLLYEHRCYSPALGRWMTRDPVGERGGLNLYAFCENDPVDNYDYLGLSVPLLLVAPDPRDKWLVFSKLYFRAVEQWHFAATLLEESLADAPRTTPLVFEEGPFAATIRLSDEYNRDLRRLVRSLPAGMNRVRESSSVEFLSGDLYAAAKQAAISYDGYVCRPISGADRVALNVTVSDTYDFSWWSAADTGKKRRWSAYVVMAGNNLAYLDQYMDFIKPFQWEVRFKESGRLPR